MAFIPVLLFAYLIGSIPFGYVLTKFAGFGDIREIGSGNIGATNVLRTGNKKLAALTLLLDGLKGTFVVLIVRYFYPDYAAAAAFAAFLGHLYPVWLKGKGGKGVATSIGIMAGLSPPLGILMIAIWLLVAATYNYSSLAALVAIGLTPILAAFLGRLDIEWLTVLVVLLVFWKHSANIERLIKGTEPKISRGKKEPPPAS